MRVCVCMFTLGASVIFNFKNEIQCQKNDVKATSLHERSPRMCEM